MTNIENELEKSSMYLALQALLGGGARVIERLFWHMLSKGMPRHAHRRWVLMSICGVDIRLVLWWWDIMCKVIKKNSTLIAEGFICHLSSESMTRHSYRRFSNLCICGVDVKQVYVRMMMTRKMYVSQHIKSGSKGKSLTKWNDLSVCSSKRCVTKKDRIFLVFMEYILISPEGEMECTQLFRVVW